VILTLQVYGCLSKEEEQEQYKRVKEERRVATTKGLVFCPTPGCNTVLEVEEEEGEGEEEEQEGRWDREEEGMEKDGTGGEKEEEQKKEVGKRQGDREEEEEKEEEKETLETVEIRRIGMKKKSEEGIEGEASAKTQKINTTVSPLPSAASPPPPPPPAAPLSPAAASLAVAAALPAPASSELAAAATTTTTTTKQKPPRVSCPSCNQLYLPPSLRSASDRQLHSMALAMNYRPCPQCFTYISGEGGCKKMTCVCGAQFCFACGKKRGGRGREGGKTGCGCEKSCHEWPERAQAPVKSKAGEWEAVVRRAREGGKEGEEGGRERRRRTGGERGE